MEDFGDLLYIVFAIIGVVYSIIKKNNKKAKESTPPIAPIEDEEEDYSGDGIPSFDQIFGRTEAPKPAVVPEQKVVQPADNSVQAKKKQLEDNIHRFKSAKAKSKLKTEESEEEIIEHETGYNFNLRQAVIYSEVLKRPEF
ncbi:hypothetical protein [Labilibacter marinus]|uniref:hypothetical protein n=1 Tax=Labilibacter marinus TaxID=1477105 RepID=UPI00117A6F75|nr:hypothetical protein [Labilibacter marinus]